GTWGRDRRHPETKHPGEAGRSTVVILSEAPAEPERSRRISFGSLGCLPPLARTVRIRAVRQEILRLAACGGSPQDDGVTRPVRSRRISHGSLEGLPRSRRPLALVPSARRSFHSPPVAARLRMTG